MLLLLLLPATASISSRFSISSEAFASELLENLEEMFIQYNMKRDKSYGDSNTIVCNTSLNG